MSSPLLWMLITVAIALIILLILGIFAEGQSFLTNKNLNIERDRVYTSSNIHETSLRYTEAKIIGSH